MYYAVSGVYGVIAGFLITAMTIVVVSDSGPASTLKNAIPLSTSFKFIYSIVTLLILSLSLALLGPFSSNYWTHGFVIGSVLISLIELIIIVLFILSEVPAFKNNGYAPYK